MRRAAKRKAAPDPRQFDLFARAEKVQLKLGRPLPEAEAPSRAIPYEAQVLNAIVGLLERQWSAAIDKKS